MSYCASTDDAVIMAKLVADLGGIGARAYIKNYGEKSPTILKVYAGSRTVMTETKFGIKNPRVVSMGLGKVGAIAHNNTKHSKIITSAHRVRVVVFGALAA